MTNSKNYGAFLDGWIISPPSFRTMSLTMSPFASEDAVLNRHIWKSAQRKGGNELVINASSGRIVKSATDALSIALKLLGLKADDEVWIETTTNNRYVSKCVTDTIEMYCNWSRIQSEKTAAILVIHEFGFVYPHMAKLMSNGLPIIEDCAYAMYSSFESIPVGQWGDYAIYSLAKMFPIQAGGILASKKNILPEIELIQSENEYFMQGFRFWNDSKSEIISRRLRNYNRLKELFLHYGIDSAFKRNAGDVPGAFMFKAKGKDLDGLKIFMQTQGIECSVFYGDESFFLPCHQRLTDGHLEYLAELVMWFFNRKS